LTQAGSKAVLLMHKQMLPISARQFITLDMQQTHRCVDSNYTQQLSCPRLDWAVFYVPANTV